MNLTAFFRSPAFARWAPPVLLGLLAVIGIALVGIATPDGAGLSDDSIAYVAGAQGLLSGQGYRALWLESRKPVTHFPPGFSSALAVLGLVGVHPVYGARLLNMVLFGGNAILLGVLGWRMTRSPWAGVVTTALFVVNASLLQVHAVAMSEPLFLFFSLLAFLSFERAWHRGPGLSPLPRRKKASSRESSCSLRWMGITGLLVALAYLTRYSGLALAATFLAAILLLGKGWPERLRLGGGFLAGFGPLVIAWSVRNLVVAGNTTNRMLIWHPVTSDTLLQGLRTFSEFLIPIEEWRQPLFKKVPEVFVGVAGLMALVILVWWARQVVRRWRSASRESVEIIGWTHGLYVFGYLGAILFSISFFDASTPLKVRILAPIYLSLLLLLVYAGVWVWRRFGRAGRGIVLVVGMLIVGVSAVGQGRTVAEWSKGGQGFASFRWVKSDILAYLRQFPPGVVIYTNEPGLVYLYTGHSCRTLPTQVDPVTGLKHENFAQGVEAVRREVEAGLAILVIFDKPGQDFSFLTEGLPQALKTGQGAVYHVPMVVY